MCAAVAIAVTVVSVSVLAQTPTGPIAKSADGKPNLTGIWQAMNSANWDLQAHEAKAGPVVSLAAAFSVPPGAGVVEGNEIPYLPEALKKKEANGANWMALDPEVKCYMPGIPRATYQPFPFQIVQSANTVVMSYEFASASRIVRMGTKEQSPAPAWMGWNVGRWEGDTLVVDVTDQMEDTWFDRAGNFHSDALHVVERYTPIDSNTLKYAATGTYAFIGGAQTEVKLTDAVSGQVLAEGMDKRIGGGSLEAAMQWQWGDAKNAMKAWAVQLADRVSSWTSGAVPPA